MDNNDIEQIRKSSGVLHQPDSTIDVSGNLNPYEQRTYLTCLKIARKIMEVDYTGLSFEASIGEFKSLMELGGHEINITRLRKALEKINNLQIRYNITGKTGGKHIKRYGSFVLISGFDIDMFKDKGAVTFSLPHQVHYNMIGQIKQARIKQGKNEVLSAQEMKYLGTFTTREIQRAMSYETTGGLKLDAWIDKWGESKYIPPIKTEDLKMVLGVEGKYKGRFRDFQRYSLDVAVKEFNDKSDKHLRYRPYRTGERITGIENPKGNVVDIQFRYKMKPKNKIPMIGEVSNVYDLIKLFPNQVQKYKTLPKILEISIKKYGVEFTRQQCEYVVGHSKKAYINFLKTMINDEAYDNYLVWKEEKNRKNKLVNNDITKDTTKDTTVENKEFKDKLEEDDKKELDTFKKLMEIQSRLMLAKTDKERLEITNEIMQLNSGVVDLDSKTDPEIYEKLKVKKIEHKYQSGYEEKNRNNIAHNVDINKVINLENMVADDTEEKKDYSEEQIQAAMEKYIENHGGTIGDLEEVKKRSEKALMRSIGKYL